MSRTVCPVCRQHHRARTPPLPLLTYIAFTVAGVTAWVVLILVLVAVFG